MKNLINFVLGGLAITAIIIFIFVSLCVVGLVILIILLTSSSKNNNNSSQSTSQTESSEISPWWDVNGRAAERYGKAGENLVAKYLLELVNSYHGYLLNDYCFQDENGHSSEIDHIVITRGGIFVIETKTNKGVVKGDVDDEKWMCIKEDYQENKTFKNPIKQNQGHINHLRRMFGKNPPKMQSIVVFPVANINRIDSDIVVDINGALNLIRTRSNEQKYSQEFVNITYKKLIDILNKYGISKVKHVQNIKTKYN